MRSIVVGLFLMLINSNFIFAQHVVDIGEELTAVGENTANRFMIGFAKVTVNGQAFYLDTLRLRWKG